MKKKRKRKESIQGHIQGGRSFHPFSSACRFTLPFQGLEETTAVPSGSQYAHTAPKAKKKKEVSMKSFSTQVANQIFNERINKNGVVISIRNTHLAFCSLGEKQLTCQNAAQWIADLCFLFLVYKFCLLLFAVKTGI